MPRLVGRPHRLQWTGFGIYLGRFLRWNSWDVITIPFPLACEIASRLLHPLCHAEGYGITIGFGVLPVLACALFRYRSV